MIRNGVALIEHGQQPFAWAVHYGFIGISNEMYAFESGVAALLGTVGAVAAGGADTVVVALIWR
jgi:hypothetical protein